MVETPKVLVDNCIDALTSTTRPATKECEVLFGNGIYKAQIAGYERRPPFGPRDQWKQHQLECLPTVARLAHESRVSLYSCQEVRFESWLRSGTIPEGDLFAGFQLHKAEAPIERSRFFQSDFSEYIRRDAVIKFCKWLLQPGIESMAENPVIQARIPEFEINNLRKVERFRELCRGRGEHQYPDAFYLWTGEVNGLNYFLTTDRKFIRAMTQSTRTPLPCVPISPEDFLTKMNVSDRDPIPFEVGQFYTISGIPG